MPLRKLRFRNMKRKNGVQVIAKRIGGVTLTHIRERAESGEPILRHIEIRSRKRRVAYTAVSKSDELTGAKKTTRRLKID